MNIKEVKLSDLKPLEKNVRKHGERQIAELVKSVSQFGQTRALVVDEENNILIGNGLYTALQSMGKETGFCYVVKGLTETEKKKLVLSDNRIFSLGVDDYDITLEYINDISLTGDFEIAGFDADTIRFMASQQTQKEEFDNYGKVEAVTESKPSTTDSSVIVKQAVQVENNSPEPQIAEERKFVVCHNCGEVIYID